jgi:hypothetical protein
LASHQSINRSFGDRFLDRSDFLRYAKELRFVGAGSGNDLDFLERERLLAPIARIRFPDPLVRTLYAGTRSSASAVTLLDTESDARAVEAALFLEMTRGQWPGLEAPRWHHVLDNLPPECTPYVDLNPGATLPGRTRRHRVQLGVQDGQPLFTSEFQHDYYRYWQILHLAEILAMKIEVLADLRDAEIMDAALHGRLESFKRRRRLNVPCLQAKIVDESAGFRPEWETVAYAHAYSRMAWGCRWFARQVGRPDPVTIDERFGDNCGHVAVTEAVSRYGTTSERLMDFLRWQCQRWDKWTDAGRALVAKEYQRNIAATVETVRVCTGLDFEAVAAKLGRVTGHFKPTLKVVLPDWVEESREEIVDHFRRRLQLLSTRCESIGLIIDVPVLHSFVNWVESAQLLAVFLHYETLREWNARAESVARAGYAKEAVALATTVEHAVNALLSGHEPVRGTVFPKLRRLWCGRPGVCKTFETYKKFTRTDNASFEEQWKAIDRIPATTGAIEIAKDLLRAVLVRNQGSHLSLAALPPQSVRDTVGVLLDVIFFCWLESRRKWGAMPATGEERDSG